LVSVSENDSLYAYDLRSCAGQQQHLQSDQETEAGTEAVRYCTLPVGAPSHQPSQHFTTHLVSPKRTVGSAGSPIDPRGKYRSIPSRLARAANRGAHCAHPSPRNGSSCTSLRASCLSGLQLRGRLGTQMQRCCGPHGAMPCALHPRKGYHTRYMHTGFYMACAWCRARQIETRECCTFIRTFRQGYREQGQGQCVGEEHNRDSDCLVTF
jgi:hypothetical protein